MVRATGITERLDLLDLRLDAVLADDNLVPLEIAHRPATSGRTPR
jgi:hypothetical protein